MPRTGVNSFGATSTSNAERVTPFLVGERGRRLYLLDPVEVDYIESDGNYVRFLRGGSEFIAREMLKQLEMQLQSCGYLRIERSLLLNVRAIEYVEPVGHGSFTFTLHSGMSLRSGRSYRDAILRVLPLRRRSASDRAAVPYDARAREQERSSPRAARSSHLSVLHFKG